MKKIIKEQNEKWEEVPASQAGKLEASGKYKVKKEGGKFYVTKKEAAPPTPPPTPKETKKEDPNKTQPSSSNLQDYVGQYKTSDGKTIDASLDNGKLRVKMATPAIDTLLDDKGNDKFEFNVYGQVGQCVGKRENGSITSVTISVASQTLTATKVGSSSTNTQQPTSSQNTQQSAPQQNSGGWPQCVATTYEDVYQIFIDKNNNKPVGFASKDDSTKFDDVKKAFPDKTIIVKKENVKYNYIDCDWSHFNGSRNLGCTIIFRKDGSFISDSAVKRGMFDCENRRVTFTSTEREILDESKIKKILKEHLYKIKL